MLPCYLNSVCLVEKDHECLVPKRGHTRAENNISCLTSLGKALCSAHAGEGRRQWFMGNKRARHCEPLDGSLRGFHSGVRPPYTDLNEAHLLAVAM